jgi:hypothetical protein
MMNRESRDAYLRKMQTKLKEWSSEIDKLKAKADASEAKIRTEYSRQIEELRVRREDIGKRMEEMRDAGEESWQELRTGTEKAWNELKTALEKAAAKFRRKKD